LGEEKELDLEKVFSDFVSQIKGIEENLTTLTKEVKENSTKTCIAYSALEEDYREFMEKCLEAGRSMEECAKEWKAKAVTSKEQEQYPAPKIAKMLEFLKGLVGKEFTATHFDRVIDILGAKPVKYPARYPAGKESEQYEAPAIARVLRYLKRKLNTREFRHVLDLLGIEAEEEEEKEGIKALLPAKTGEEKDITEHPAYKLLMETSHWGEVNE